MEKSKKVEGIILKNLYRSEITGYTIAYMRMASGFKKISGIMSGYVQETPLLLELKPPENGKDLWSIISIDENVKDIGFIQRFLKILQFQDQDAKSVIDEIKKGTPLYDVLKKISSTHPYLTKGISEVLLPRQQRMFREYLNQINPGNGIKYYAVNAYVRKVGSVAKDHFQRNAYQVCIKDFDMKLKEATDLCKNLHIPKAEERQIEAAGIFLMKNAETSKGSTCLPAGEVKEKIQENLYAINGQAVSKSTVERVLNLSNVIVQKKGCITFSNSYQNEMVTSNMIHRLMSRRHILFTVGELAESIKLIETTEGIKYAPQQVEAFKLLQQTGVCVLTGGPGTGKTTVIKGLMTAYREKYPLSDIIMCSPTGRAAQRMTESTGQTAMTVHRLVSIGRQARGKEPIKGDVFIIDETSMLDSQMAAWLMMAIPNDALVIFVGDVDQLPSVGPGNVLRDMIASETIPVCRLKTVYRQSGESPIITNANKINSGDHDLVTNEAFHIYEQPSDKAILEKMKAVVQEIWKKNKDVFDFQVLATSYKYDAGIEEANIILQEMVNPDPEHKKPCLNYGAKTVFRLGDKVITTNNNYEDGYFNGDIGQIYNIDADGIDIKIGDRKVKVKRHNIMDVSLGYCISIHKSQGSEFGHAIILLPEKPEIMLKRNLLYTALTRAKRECTIIAAPKTLDKCAVSVDTNKRETMLASLIAEGQTVELKTKIG